MIFSEVNIEKYGYFKDRGMEEMSKIFTYFRLFSLILRISTYFRLFYKFLLIRQNYRLSGYFIYYSLLLEYKSTVDVMENPEII